MLCRALQSTGVAGKPSEWLNYHNASNLLDKYQLDNYAELQQQLWKLGSTSNGVFGVKTGACEPYLSGIIDTFSNFQAEIPNLITVQKFGIKPFLNVNIFI